MKIPAQRVRRPVIDRLLEKAIRNPDSGCWEWTAHRFENGYGAIIIEKKVRKAHRVSYELHCGPIPDGARILHKCDNPSCINPDHLRIGTQTENVEDMIAKGRKALGERTGVSKLTEQDVIAIRRSTEPSRKIATTYGVGKTTINSIRAGKYWKHI